VKLDSSTAAVPKAPINNKPSANQKTSPALPSVLSNASDKFSSSNQVELARGNANVGSLEVKLDSEPPPPAAPRTILKPVSGGVLNGTALNLPAPTYPEAARRLRTSGLVTIEVIVDETGKVISAVATGGPMGLRDVAIQAALKARFSPTKLSGQPVKVAGLINYKFSLAQ
jgi:protein TonB